MHIDGDIKVWTDGDKACARLYADGSEGPIIIHASAPLEPIRRRVAAAFAKRGVSVSGDDTAYKATVHRLARRRALRRLATMAPGAFGPGGLASYLARSEIKRRHHRRHALAAAGQPVGAKRIGPIANHRQLWNALRPALAAPWASSAKPQASGSAARMLLAAAPIVRRRRRRRRGRGASAFGAQRVPTPTQIPALAMAASPMATLGPAASPGGSGGGQGAGRSPSSPDEGSYADEAEPDDGGETETAASQQAARGSDRGRDEGASPQDSPEDSPEDEEVTQNDGNDSDDQDEGDGLDDGAEDDETADEDEDMSGDFADENPRESRLATVCAHPHVKAAMSLLSAAEANPRARRRVQQIATLAGAGDATARKALAALKVAKTVKTLRASSPSTALARPAPVAVAQPAFTWPTPPAVPALPAPPAPTRWWDIFAAWRRGNG